MHIRTLVLVCLASTLFAPRAEAQFQASNPAPGENYHVELGAMFWTPQPGIVILSGSLAPLSSAPAWTSCGSSTSRTSGSWSCAAC